MARTTARIEPRWPTLARLADHAVWGTMRLTADFWKSYGEDSSFARTSQDRLRAKLASGRSVYILGITPGGHNTGVALVRASLSDGVELLSNHEEERFRGEKHCMKFPLQSLMLVQEELREHGLSIDTVDAVVLGWDYQRWAGASLACVVGEFPHSLQMLKREASPVMRPWAIAEALYLPTRLKKLLGTKRRIPVIHLPHHDNHAAISYAMSPFAGRSTPTAVVVLDGAGDSSSISWYRCEGNRLEQHYCNNSLWDSLGAMYAALSSSLGGWPVLQCEGRFMGASAWGNMDRLTNPYYSQLREVFHFGPSGTVSLNRSLAGWHHRGFARPFTKRLMGILGPPIPPEQMWNPDAVLNVDDIKHTAVTRDRVDKAAAVQLLFEDAVFHIVGHVIRSMRVDQLVLSGGTALNCVANMRLLEHFDSAWYGRYLNRPESRLHLWVPPVPNDEGVAAGAAFNFALKAGAPVAPPDRRMKHAFYCGRAPTQSEITAALCEVPDVKSIQLANIRSDLELKRIADLVAYIVSRNGVLGLYQGIAETGPRALGHRSILANATNPETLQILNSRVKFRESIRPLAPMLTLAAAHKYFELSPGAADDNYNAYNYMILTAHAREIARQEIPAVVHQDGTGRVQIVRRETDEFSHEYLLALGRYIGAEASVNTSLNVGAPIAQTPKQAIATLVRSGGMHGLLMIAEDGTATIAWHHIATEYKDLGQTLNHWLTEHAAIWQT